MNMTSRLALVVMLMLGSAVLAQPPAGLPPHALVRIGDSRFHGGGYRMRFTPDGKTLAVVSNENLRLLDVATGAERLVLRHLSRSTPKSSTDTAQDVVEFALAADGKTLVSADETGVIRVWDLTRGQPRSLPQKHVGVATLCLSSDEKSVFTGGFDGVLQEWLLTDGELKKSWTAPGKQPIIAVAAFGRQVSAVSRDGVLYTWDPATGQPTRQVELGSIAVTGGYAARIFPAKGQTRFADDVRNVEFSADGKRLVQHNGQQIWDVESGKVLANLPPTKGMKDALRLALAQDGKVVVTAPTGYKESMRAFKSDSAEELGRLALDRVTAVAVAPDGQTVAYAADNRIRLWKPATKEILGGGDAIGRVSDWDLSPDGKRIAVATYDHVLYLYDAQTGKRLDTFSTEDRRANLVRFHPDGQTMIVGVSGVGILHYAKKDGSWQVARRFPMKEQLFDVSGRGPFVPFNSKATTLMNMETGKTIFRPGNVAYSQFSYSPDGRWLVVHAEGQFKAVAPRFKSTGREFQILRVPELTKVQSLSAGFTLDRPAFSTDGRLVMMGPGSVKLFEIISGAERLHVLMPFGRGGIAFTPDGKGLVVGSDDGDIVLLDLPKGQEAYRVKNAHKTRISEIRHAAGGKIISVANDNTFMIWSPDLWKGRIKVSPLKLDAEDCDLFHENLKAPGGPNVASAIDTLIRGGDSTATYFKTKLKPATEQTTPMDAERLREHRMLEILEAVGTPTARMILQGLTEGHPTASLTIEAKGAMQRLVAP